MLVVWNNGIWAGDQRLRIEIAVATDHKGGKPITKEKEIQGGKTIKTML